VPNAPSGNEKRGRKGGGGLFYVIEKKEKKRCKMNPPPEERKKTRKKTLKKRMTAVPPTSHWEEETKKKQIYDRLGGEGNALADKEKGKGLPAVEEQENQVRVIYRGGEEKKEGKKRTRSSL